MQMTRREILASAAAVSLAASVESSHAAAPPAGKQVPGIYRYKVGSIEVSAITDGGREAPLADNFVRNASRDDVNAALQAAFLPKDKFPFVFTACVVNTGSKLIVIDTGNGPAAFEQSKGAVGQFHNNLAAAGIDRNAVDAVIISHFHGDHIGGLVTADNKPAFPNAEVMVPAGEWAYWMDDANMNRMPEAQRGGFANARRVFTPLGSKVTKYEGAKELVPGITAIPTPGHTPGHTSHRISSGSDSVIIQADVTNHPAVFVRNPGWHASFDVDPVLAEQSRRKLYDQLVADRTMVQGYHFPFPAAGYAEKVENGYRFVPINWNPTL